MTENRSTPVLPNPWWFWGSGSLLITLPPFALPLPVSDTSSLGVVLTLRFVGIALLIVGSGLFARSMGRSPALGLLAVLGIPGVAIATFLATARVSSSPEVPAQPGGTPPPRKPKESILTRLREGLGEGCGCVLAAPFVIGMAMMVIGLPIVATWALYSWPSTMSNGKEMHAVLPAFTQGACLIFLSYFWTARAVSRDAASKLQAGAKRPPIRDAEEQP